MPNIVLSGSNQIRTVSTATNFSSLYLYKGNDWLQFATDFCVGTLDPFDENQKQLTDNTSITSDNNDKCKNIPLYAIEDNNTKFHMHGKVGLNDIGITTPDAIGFGVNYMNDTAIQYGAKSSQEAFMWNMHGRLDGGLSNINTPNAQNISVTKTDGVLTIKIFEGSTEISSASANIDDLLPPYFYVVVNTPGVEYAEEYETRYSFASNYDESWPSDSTGGGKPYFLIQGFKNINSTRKFYKPKEENYTTGRISISNWLNHFCVDISDAGWYRDKLSRTNVWNYFYATDVYQENFSTTGNFFRCGVAHHGAILWEGISCFHNNILDEQSYFTNLINHSTRKGWLKVSGDSSLAYMQIYMPPQTNRFKFGAFSNVPLTSCTFDFHSENSIHVFQGVKGDNSCGYDNKNPFLNILDDYTSNPYPSARGERPEWFTGASTLNNSNTFFSTIGFNNFYEYNLNSSSNPTGRTYWVFPTFYSVGVFQSEGSAFPLTTLKGLVTREKYDNVSGVYLDWSTCITAKIYIRNSTSHSLVWGGAYATSGGRNALTIYNPVYSNTNSYNIYKPDFDTTPYLIDICFHYKN